MLGASEGDARLLALALPEGKMGETEALPELASDADCEGDSVALGDDVAETLALAVGDVSAVG
jgi:hypothetical protein